MKKIIFLGLCITMCLTSFNAEGKDIEVAEGVKRSELIKKDLGAQKRAFQSCSDDVKAQLYIFKIKKDLKSKELNEDDKAALKNCLTILKSGDNEEGSAYKAFTNEIEAQSAKLGWDEEKRLKFYMIIMTAKEYDDQFCSWTK